MAVARLSNVTFSYDASDGTALHDVSITIESGGIYGIIGANAAGKSTLCALIRGLIPTFHGGDLTGDVEILDKPLGQWGAGELSTRIGYVFQNPFTQISGIKATVFEEIAMGLENLGHPVDAIIDEVGRIVELTGLQQLIAKNPNELSGGQRQKVAFASVLVMDTEVIVMDEPTSQLDPDATEAIFTIIGSLRVAGKTIILVEHKMDLLAQYADHIIVLDGGTVTAAGPTRSVLADPALERWGARRPEITALALTLGLGNRTGNGVPLTRAEAVTALQAERTGR